MSDLVLTPGVSIYLQEGLPDPVARAAQDLARDLRDVFGKPSPIVSFTGAIPAGEGVVISGDCEKYSFSREDVTGREAHGVFIEAVPQGRYAFLLGTDMRGVIYAIYTFSEHVLGVPPLWYWASWEPQTKAEIRMPVGASWVYPAPYVKWRCIFPNDERMYRRFEKRSKEKFEALYETMLRLKLNVLEVGPLHKFPQQAGENNALKRARAAHKYGIALTNHHIYALGAGLRHWQAYWQYIHGKEVPPLSMQTFNRADMRTFWEDHIQWILEEGFEMIWSIGFRGLGDQPWFAALEDAPESDFDRARMMEEMMAFQVGLLEDVAGPDVTMRTQLYDEGGDFFASGALRPPADPRIIWSFADTPFCHYPNRDIMTYTPSENQPIGYYFHYQFTSTGAHFAQGEGPWKMEKNLRLVDARSRRPLAFTVANAGNVRELVFELSAYAKMVWDFEAYSSDTFLEAFCGQYYSQERALQIASLYRDYYVSFWESRAPDDEDWRRQYIFTDLRMMRAIENMIDRLPKGFTPWPLIDPAGDSRYFQVSPTYNGAETQLAAIITGTANTMKRLEAVIARCDDLLAAIPMRGRRFFEDNLVIQTRYMYHLTTTLHELAQAMAARPRSSARSNQPIILRHVRQAEAAFSQALSALREAEHAPFEGWTRPEDFQLQDNVDKLIAMRENLEQSRF